MAHPNSPSNQRQHSGRALLGGLAIVLLTASCADDESSSSATVSESGTDARAGEVGEATSFETDQQPAAAIDQSAEAPEATDAPGSGTVTPASGLATQVVPDRLLVVDVTIDVEVADVGPTVADVIAAAARHDGQVYGSNVQLADDETASAQIVIKLPPAEVDAAVAEIAALGKLITEVQSTDDVTDTVTDINTRIITAQRSVDRVQLLLAEAKNLGEVVQLEAELTARQTVLEQLLAQQRNLGQQTALATLTVVLHAMPIDEAVGTSDSFEVTGPVEAEDSIGDSFRRGGDAFLAAAAAVLIFIGYTAPFLAIALVVIAAWGLSRRRVRRNRSAAPLLPPAPDAGRRTSEPDSAGAART